MGDKGLPFEGTHDCLAAGPVIDQVREWLSMGGAFLRVCGAPVRLSWMQRVNQDETEGWVDEGDDPCGWLRLTNQRRELGAAQAHG